MIDWENCGLADPGQELAGVVFEFWLGEPDRAERSIAGTAGRRPGARRPARDFSMTIAQLGHIPEMACRAWLDPSEPEEERRRQVGRVAECVDEPLTLAVIDELLEAVG